MPSSRARRPGVLVCLIIAVLGIGFAGTIWYSVSSRADQKSDFNDDVIAMGFRFKDEPSWDDEVNLETGDSESKLELVVKIASCDVEIQQLEGEESSTTVNGRTIEYFTIDEIVDEVDDVEGSPKGALSPGDIKKFLQGYHPRLACIK